MSPLSDTNLSHVLLENGYRYVPIHLNFGISPYMFQMVSDILYMHYSDIPCDCKVHLSLLLSYYLGTKETELAPTQFLYHHNLHKVDKLDNHNNYILHKQLLYQHSSHKSV